MEFNLRKFLGELRKHLARDGPPYRQGELDQKVARYDEKISTPSTQKGADPMDRRSFMIAIGSGIGTAAGIIPNAWAQSRSESKSRKLAQYLADGNKPSYGTVKALPHLLGVKWVVDYEGIRYTVFASQYKGKCKLGQCKPDKLEVRLNPLPIGKGTGESLLRDDGLDDLVDVATIDNKTTLFNKSGRVLSYDRTDTEGRLTITTPIWEINPLLEPYMQKVYGKVLETLEKLAGYQKAK